LSRKYQKKAQHIKIDATTDTPPQIEQFLYYAEADEKLETLFKILQNHPSPCTLIFCRMKQTVNDIGQKLQEMKISADVLHGDLEQPERDRATALFRNGSLRILVATDVAARGLDIDTLELVVNYDLPSGTDIYLHRIGRTGRAGRKGAAVSIATEYEVRFVSEIEDFTGVKMNRPVLKKGSMNIGDFKTSPMKTLHIAGGKKDKLRAGDILGALTAAPGPIPGADIGKIDVQERSTYVAVKSVHAEAALQKLRNSKIKGSKFKIYPA
jgi:ATP-independent RNA helicase DbpA